MYRSIQLIGLTLALLVLTAGVVMGQPVQFTKVITFSCVGSPVTDSMVVGVNSGDPAALPPELESTYMPDVGTEMGATGRWKELAAPASPPPLYYFRVYGLDVRPGSASAWPAGVKLRPYDFRQYDASNQVDSFLINITAGPSLADGIFPESGLTISWPAGLGAYATTWKLMRKTSSSPAPLGTFVDMVPNMATGTTYTDLVAATKANANYLLIKTGAFTPPPGPTISMSPNPLDFGKINKDLVSTLAVTVTNTGSTNPLTIPVGGITMPFPCYTLVEALPITVGASSSATIHITFTAPTLGGIFNGDVLVANNSTVNPYTLAIQGESVAQGGQLQIAPIATVLDNSTADGGMYQAIIELASYSGENLKAVQFTLTTLGKTVIGPITKTGTFATDNWVLSTNVVSRTAQPDGSSIDVVNVVLYGNGTTSQAPISAAIPVLKFNYNVINISLESDDATMCLSNILGSTSIITSAKLNTDACETITILNRTVWGDINDDDRVDILDLLMVADHITGRHLLVGQEITRANVGDWPVTEAAPLQTLPIEINVLDLVGLQKIIMDGRYPDGTTTSGTPKVAVASMAKESANRATFHVTKNGIALRVENVDMFKGAQFDVTGIINAPTGVNSSLFNQCSAQLNENQTMRVLVFGQNVVGLGRGNRIVAEIPMKLTNLMTIGIKNLTLANANNEAMSLERENGEIVFTGAPEIPTEFAISQNYPNPFNPNTNITFSIPEPSDVRIMIYNMLGQEVRVLFAGQMDRGTNTISWDGKDMSGRALASGTYIYRMVAGTFVESKKMMLLK